MAALAHRGMALRFGAADVRAVAVAGWQELGHRVVTTGPEILLADALRTSIEMARDHLLSGTGLGTWSRSYPRYAGLDLGLAMNQAHNDWAQWAAEGGLPFLACLLVFAALSWKPAIRSIYGVGGDRLPASRAGRLPDATAARAGGLVSCTGRDDDA
jgi:hypothetical protein